MPKLNAIAALAVSAIFCAVAVPPSAAQVMKNFSWKKKSAKAKPDAETAVKSPTGQAPATRQKAKPGR